MTENRDDSPCISTTLLILFGDLDPADISRALRMFPDRSWTLGERPLHQAVDGHWFESPHAAKWGGWKCFLSDSLKELPLDEQLEYWADVLLARRDAVESLRTLDCEISIDCFVSTSDSYFVGLEPGLLSAFAKLGVSLDIHMFTDQKSAPAIPPAEKTNT